MKKYFIILLLLVYGLSSTGMSVHLHYCCGELDDITFSAPVHDKSCAKDQSVKKERCCDNKQIDLKIKGDQQPAAKWVQAQSVVKAPAVEAVPFVFFCQQPTPVNERSTGPPPKAPALPVFLKNCVFRI